MIMSNMMFFCRLVVGQQAAESGAPVVRLEPPAPGRLQKVKIGVHATCTGVLRAPAAVAVALVAVKPGGTFAYRRSADGVTIQLAGGRFSRIRPGRAISRPSPGP